MKVHYLADHPEVVTKLAISLHGEWGHLPGNSIDGRIHQLHLQQQRSALPCAFVAFEGENLAGSASFVEHDMITHPEWFPWLASVYVWPEFRRRGIGSALTERVVEEARALGHSRIYLFTTDQQRLYLRLGWREVVTEVYNTRQVTVMLRQLR